jgi:hypothetical protein
LSITEIKGKTIAKVFGTFSFDDLENGGMVVSEQKSRV